MEGIERWDTNWVSFLRNVRNHLFFLFLDTQLMVHFPDSSSSSSLLARHVCLLMYTNTLVTGLDEMRLIPEPGPNQKQQYGRSERRYLDLKKKIKLCQNRGGKKRNVVRKLEIVFFLLIVCLVVALQAQLRQEQKVVRVNREDRRQLGMSFLLTLL
jgi:hypothetical protein